MVAMLRVVTVLLLVCTSTKIDVLARSHREGKHSSSSQAIQDDGMTFESFMEEGGNDASTFGADILQEYHFRTLECRMNITKLELRYQLKIRKLFKYFRDVEKVLKVPSFTKLIKQNQHDVERNVHNTMNNLERERMGKMREAHKACDRDTHVWLESKLAEAVNLAKSLIRTDPFLFADFLEKTRLFQSKLYSHKRMCTEGRGAENTTVTCDLNDLQLLLNFTNTLIGRMNYVRDVYFSDDEEPLGSSRNKVGSGTMEDDEDHFDDQEESSASSGLEESVSLEDEAPPLQRDPILSRSPAYSRQSPPSRGLPQLPHTDRVIDVEADMDQTTSTGSDTHLTTERPSNSEVDMKLTTRTESGNDSTAARPGDFKSEVLSYTTSHLTRSKEEYPTPASASTGFHGSDKQQVNTEESQADEHLVESQATPDNGVMDPLEEGDPEPENEDRNVPAAPAQEQEQPADEEVAEDSVVILSDPKQVIDDRSGHTRSGNTHRVLVILAALVGVVLLTVLVMVAMLAFFAAKKRQQQKSGYVRVLLTSETEATNETLEGIKKDGYVNPTYKFYTRC